MARNASVAWNGDVDWVTKAPSGDRSWRIRPVEVVAVEPVQVGMAGVGQVRDHDIVAATGGGEALHLDEGIPLDDFHPRVSEGIAVEFGQRAAQPVRRIGIIAAEQPQQVRVDVDQGDCFRAPPQDVANGEAVAAAEDEHLVATVGGKHRRRRQIGVVDALVVGGELQPAR